MDNKLTLFKKILYSFQEMVSMSQKPAGDANTIEKKKNFSFDDYLRVFHAFEIYMYLLVDLTSNNVIEVGGPVKQFTGYEKEMFLNKGYGFALKVHRLLEMAKAAKGGAKYWKYLYNQPPEKRPFIKSNRIMDVITKDGTAKPVLIQSIPVLFNDKMQVVYMLNIISDVSEFYPKKTFKHFITDSSDPENIIKIKLDDKDDFTNMHKPLLSAAEIRVLELMGKGLSSKQIAAELFLSEFTVSNHRKSMLKKTESASSAELIRKAVSEGWI